ncbi:nuclease-related domain-containing protein [Macrococcus lamae]|uniref:nuclease-related domain-containing protein n=1 Tax=Macrococcus lamae TaxID=198484 RepID=UPI00140DB9D6|nr:nuclease-related domain-containing protein [Macrococcus lamae]
MLLKSYAKHQEFLYLEALDTRVVLDDDDYRQLKKYQSGYDGECQFYQLIETLDAVVLWDIMLKDSEFVQYDFIVIAGGQLFVFDIKNHRGVYQNDAGNLVRGTHCIKDPRSQLKRAIHLLRTTLAGAGIDRKITGRIIFINDTFRLIGFDGDPDIVFAAQLNHVISHLKTLRPTEADIAVGQMLVGQHFGEYPYKKREKLYDAEIDARLRCMKCRKLLDGTNHNKKYIICRCGHLMKREAVMLANLQEMMAIKQETFTIQDAMEWTSASRSTVKRFLRKYAIKTGNNHSTKYELKDEFQVGGEILRSEGQNMIRI